MNLLRSILDDPCFRCRSFSLFKVPPDFNKLLGRYEDGLTRNHTIKMVGPKLKRDLQKILPFGLIWLLSGWVFLIVELAAVGSFSHVPNTAIKMDTQIFALSSIALIGVGLLTGFIELKYLRNRFSNKKFIFRFLYKLLIYSFFFFLIVLITFPIAASIELNTYVFDPEVWEKYLSYFTSITHLSTGIQLATSLIISLFYTEMSDFIGQGVLSNFFTGKYHQPAEEERIFMFLDMKSSTTIAEQLGHLRYFKLLREYYNCFTDAIIEYGGEVYEYVGDEIILSWKFQKSEADHRCIDCFYAMKDHLQRRVPWFIEQFGVAPSFKAGVHFGKVTIGEIGTLKKEMMFSGDVLNVTARIQSLCNTYGVDLIISGDLIKQFQSDHGYKAYCLGESKLRGKEEMKTLYTLV